MNGGLFRPFDRAELNRRAASGFDAGSIARS
jgi:hypothetical protein